MFNYTGTVHAPNASMEGNDLLSTVANISLEEEERINLMLTGIPVITFLATLCFFGTFGNSLTVIVYAVRFKPSIHRTFILWLGTVDLVACSVSIPYVIYDSLHPFTFTAEWACKIFVLINFVFSMYSPLLLDVIAIERYRRICKPTERQLTRKEARMISGLMGLLVVLSCSPFLVMYGSKPVTTPFNNLQGYECNVVEQYRASLFETIYFTILFALYIMLFVLCIVFYSLIGQKLMKSERFRRATKAAKRIRRQKTIRQSERLQRQKSVKFAPEVLPVPLEKPNETPVEDNIVENEPTTSAGTELSISSVSGTCELQPNNTSDDLLEDQNQANNHQLYQPTTVFNGTEQMNGNTSDPIVILPAESPTEVDTLNENNNANSMKTDEKFNAKIESNKPTDVVQNSSVKNKSVKRFVDHRISKKKVSQLISKSKRVTMMFLVVSVLSFGGYLPYFAHVIMRNVDDDMRRNVASAFGSIGPIMRYSFFINNVVNPIVYGFMDRHFRDQFKRMIKKLRKNRMDFA